MREHHRRSHTLHNGDTTSRDSVRFQSEAATPSLESLILMFLAQASEPAAFTTAFDDEEERRGGVISALGATDGDFGAAFGIAGLAGGSEE
jgi:hypothetical protein